jgi:carboxyl-terminal processing protease
VPKAGQHGTHDHHEGITALIRTLRSSWFFVVVAIALAGCSGSMPSGSAPGSVSSSATAGDLAFYRSVLDKVHQSYVDPVSDSSLVDKSLKGMLTGLDPHSDYLSEKDYQDMLDDSAGEFAGIGAELTRQQDRPVVLSPIDDTPASRAGIHPGDVILRIDGHVTEGMSLKDVVDALRGPANSKVSITIGRKNTQPFDVSLTRAIIHVDSVKSALEPNGVGYIRITSFAETTQREVAKAIDDLKAKNHGQLKGLVLDLRNNPGGLLDQAVRVSGDFLNGGTTVSIRGRSPDDNRVFPAPPGGDRLPNVPMVVLINGASASAAEIVAGALQDRHRAEVLGTQSFGKGSVQTIIPLDGHGALRLTTARYYTPSGRSIQGQGIAPDRVVEQPKGDQTAEVDLVREADLPGALDTGTKAKTGAAGAANKPIVKSETLIEAAAIGTAKDYQLKAALDDLDKKFQVGAAGGR